MKIISWLFAPVSFKQPEEFEVDDVVDAIDDFEVVEKGYYTQKKDFVAHDPMVFRLNNPDRVPIIILPELMIKELKRTLFGFEKNLTVVGMLNRICTENNLKRTGYYFYFLDEQVLPNRKLLLLGSSTVEELDKKYSGAASFLYLSMGKN
jgi:hypothetical protein